VHPADAQHKPPRSDWTSPWIAWALLLMGLAAFAPCILIPEWQAYREACIAGQRERSRMEAWQKQVDRERRLMEAIQTDPTVVARLAQRELGYRDPDATAVRVAVSMDETPIEPDFVPRPVPLPALVARVAAFLPRLNYEKVFTDTDSRLVILVMAVTLMAVAVWIPSRHGRRARP
jgi:hypothetical protein